MDNEITALDNDQIKSRIFTIRGAQVMLDKDIAALYEVKPTRLREQVKRNKERFPRDFMFQLTDDEVDSMVSQNAIPSKQHLGGSLPFVFTEQGVASLSGILKSQKAAEVHVQVMRSFVEMRHVIQDNAVLLSRLESVERRQIAFESEALGNFKELFDALNSSEQLPTEGIFFDGQIYDAYIFASDLIKSAQTSIVLVDNYVDDTALTLLTKRRKGCSATIYTQSISKQLKLDLKKHNEQYPSVEIKQFRNAHDRFLILDGKEIYHIGASLKDLGKKWFAFSKFEKDALEILAKLER